MTVFKAFWKVVNKYKGTIILYTVMLIVFGGVNMTTSEKQINFTNVKPDILIINNDNDNKISNNLIEYIKDNSNIIEIENDEEKINDALFYRDVNYIIYIPQDYGKKVMNNENPVINIKSTGDYGSSLAEMMLTKYIKVQNTYKSITDDEDKLIELINNNLKTESKVEMISKLDTTKTNNASFYFNFASYSIMAAVIFIICLVISSFKETNISKRTIVSSMHYKKYNKSLLLSSCIYSIVVWIFYVILGIFILKDSIFTTRGLIYILNMFTFTICSLTIALLISNLINNKNAVSGIVNVVALGSSFLCGVFVPAEWLPKTVLNIAHILPTYWYVNSNDILKTLEVINFSSIKPILINNLVIIGFIILFIVINNIVTKKKRKIG